MQILAVDIGTNAQELLLLDSERGTISMTLPSPTVLIARAIRAATRREDDVFLTGVTMGGGACTRAVRAHLAQGRHVFATPQVAHTFADDLAQVEAMGVHIVTDREHPSGTIRLEMRDLDFGTISRAFAAIGVPFTPDALAMAVFDHGVAPPGGDEITARFQLFQERLLQRTDLLALAYNRSNIPARMRRMRAVASSAPPTIPLLMMEPAWAAMIGSMQDPTVHNQDTLLMAHLGHQHTIVIHLAKDQVAGLFEHHTVELTPAKLDRWITALLNGTLTAAQIADDNGHGALLLSRSLNRTPFLVAIGGQSNLLYGSERTPYFATPFGETTAPGCWGLIHSYATLHLTEAGPIMAALEQRRSI